MAIRRKNPPAARPKASKTTTRAASVRNVTAKPTVTSSVSTSTTTPRPAASPSAQPGFGLRPGDVVIPPLFKFDHIGNLFEKDRAGIPVVRPDDLLALRIELRNLVVNPGDPPRLMHAGSGKAYLILHFPPQSITEETFFERAQPGTSDSDAPESGNASESLRTPPVRARIAGESRLVFNVPNDFDVPYTLAGVLDACQALSLSVNANARPRASRSLVITLDQLFSNTIIATLTPQQRASLSSYAASTARIAALHEDDATVRMRHYAAPGNLRAQALGQGTSVAKPKAVVNPPKPAPPSAVRTSIEMPWRLVLSPHSGERWQHSRAPATSPTSGHTELWHTRLIAPDKDGDHIEPPHPDPKRTLRAIWALTGEASTASMSGTFPGSTQLPAPSLLPFRMPLDDFDRFQVCHLSSNFSLKGYAPEPIDTDLAMLSALGGWLDSRGAWDPPGLSVEEWVHRASMARDHYVRVVYRGFLFPFGHRVSLVKVSERKFHNGARDGNGEPTIESVGGNVAYLRQRLFIVVRERERRFDLPAYQNLEDKAKTRHFINQLPFSRVRILTQVTPNLDMPTVAPSAIAPYNDQRMFWPHVMGSAFRFQCVATDLDGRTVSFDLPMIFMDNTLACPRTPPNRQGYAKPDYPAAESAATHALSAYDASSDKRIVPFKRQRVALATSLKAGDTSVELEDVTFSAEVEPDNKTLRNASEDLTRPVFFPKITTCVARVGPLAHLGGSNATNTLGWNAHYLKQGFAANTGEVFVDIVNEPGMAMLDFSAQGDRSGGFVQPNVKPQALSRLAGPVMGDVNEFIKGKVPEGGGFPTSLSDLPLPLLFGCIPLAEILEQIANVADSPEKVPKFASEASTQLESFVNEMARSYGLVADMAAQPASIAAAATDVFRHTLTDLLAQAEGLAAAQVAPLQAAATQVETAIGQLASELQAITGYIDDPAIAGPLANLPGRITALQNKVGLLAGAANAQVNGTHLPAGLRQSVLALTQQVDGFLGDLATLVVLVQQGQVLYHALHQIVGEPQNLAGLFDDPTALQARIDALVAAIAPFRTTLAGFDVLSGAPRKIVLDALAALEDILALGATLVEMLAGDELTIRFDWNPQIASWWLPGANKASDDPIFRANDRHGFIVAVEAKVKKNGSSSPKVGVVCSLKHFDLVLIAPASFLELNFEKIEFAVDSAAKMDVDVLLSDVKFVGPLSFVETLRDLIPLDGFSDPPYLDITPQGIDAGFDIALPGICVGVLNINNLSLGAGFTVPFIGQPLSVRFNFCTREQPFLLTVYMFGGGGFFGVTVDPHGVQILEAAFEFGASVSVDFGVASGGVHVMAGIYFRMETDEASLTGYFRLGGHVDVLGLISASLELYLELRYEFESGKCVGKAQLTIEISVFVFSGSVTITCQRKFAGSNGDPSLRQMLGYDASVPLETELQMIDDHTAYAWREYCEAFA